MQIQEFQTCETLLIQPIIKKYNQQVSQKIAYNFNGNQQHKILQILLSLSTIENPHDYVLQQQILQDKLNKLDFYYKGTDNQEDLQATQDGSQENVLEVQQNQCQKKFPKQKCFYNQYHQVLGSIGSIYTHSKDQQTHQNSQKSLQMKVLDKNLQSIKQLIGKIKYFREKIKQIQCMSQIKGKNINQLYTRKCNIKNYIQQLKNAKIVSQKISSYQYQKQQSKMNISLNKIQDGKNKITIPIQIFQSYILSSSKRFHTLQKDLVRYQYSPYKFCINSIQNQMCKIIYSRIIFRESISFRHLECQLVIQLIKKFLLFYFNELEHNDVYRELAPSVQSQDQRNASDKKFNILSKQSTIANKQNKQNVIINVRLNNMGQRLYLKTRKLTNIIHYINVESYLQQSFLLSNNISFENSIIRHQDEQQFSMLYQRFLSQAYLRQSKSCYHISFQEHNKISSLMQCSQLTIRIHKQFICSQLLSFTKYTAQYVKFIKEFITKTNYQQGQIRSFFDEVIQIFWNLQNKYKWILQYLNYNFLVTKIQINLKFHTMKLIFHKIITQVYFIYKQLINKQIFNSISQYFCNNKQNIQFNMKKKQLISKLLGQFVISLILHQSSTKNTQNSITWRYLIDYVDKKQFKQLKNNIIQELSLINNHKISSNFQLQEFLQRKKQSDIQNKIMYLILRKQQQYIQRKYIQIKVTKIISKKQISKQNKLTQLQECHNQIQQFMNNQDYQNDIVESFYKFDKQVFEKSIFKIITRLQKKLIQQQKGSMQYPRPLINKQFHSQSINLLKKYIDQQQNDRKNQQQNKTKNLQQHIKQDLQQQIKKDQQTNNYLIFTKIILQQISLKINNLLTIPSAKQYNSLTIDKLKQILIILILKNDKINEDIKKSIKKVNKQQDKTKRKQYQLEQVMFWDQISKQFVNQINISNQQYITQLNVLIQKLQSEIDSTESNFNIVITIKLLIDLFKKYSSIFNIQQPKQKQQQASIKKYFSNLIKKKQKKGQNKNNLQQQCVNSSNKIIQKLNKLLQKIAKCKK